MATSTNIVEFKSTHRMRSRFASGTPAAAINASQKQPLETVSAEEESPELDVSSVPVESQDLRLNQNELYPVRQAFRAEHITALRLLTVATGRFRRALESLGANDLLGADTEIQKIQVLLPELFCCRSLGDGFGAIVNSLISAFEGLAGNIPEVNHVRVMSKVLQLLKDKPFLSADEADEQIELLESAGLSIYPAELVEFLSSE